MKKIQNVIVKIKINKNDIECGYLKCCEINDKINQILGRYHNGYIIWCDNIFSQKNEIILAKSLLNGIPYLECEMSLTHAAICKFKFDDVCIVR